MSPERNLWVRSKADLDELKKILRIKSHQDRIVLALDFGSSCTKLSFSFQDGGIPWINFDSQIIKNDNIEVNYITGEFLDLFFQALIIIIEECHLTSRDVLALTGFTHSLVIVNKDDKAVALLDDPSYEVPYTEELGRKLISFGFSDEIIQRLKDGGHCSLAKLLAVIKNQDDFIKVLNLSEDFFVEGVCFTTFQGYLISRLFGLEFGLISQADWQSFGNPTLEQMQWLLIECGFLPHAFLKIYGNEFKPSEGTPLICSSLDYVAEVEIIISIMKELGIKNLETDKILISIATDTVGKVVAEGLIEGMKSLPEQNASYLTQRFLGKGYGLVEQMIGKYLYTGEGEYDHYRMADATVSNQLVKLQEEGLESYRPEYYFFPKEDGTYLLFDSFGHSYDVDQLTDKVYQDTGEEAVERLIFEIIAGISFSLRQKILFVKEKLIVDRRLAEATKQELQVLLYGGMAAHSFNHEKESWGNGFCEILIAALPPEVKTAILHLDSAAQAVLINIAKRYEIGIDDKLTMTQLDKKSGLLETAYQAWSDVLQELIGSNKLQVNFHAGLMPVS